MRLPAVLPTILLTDFLECAGIGLDLIDDDLEGNDVEVDVLGANVAIDIGLEIGAE